VNPEALYHAALLSLARAGAAAPRLDAPDARAARDSPLCGDEVLAEVRVREGRLAEIGLHVRGCVLCQAAAAVVRGAAPGLGPAELSRARAATVALLAGGGLPPRPPWEALAAFLPAREVPSRHACVLLPFDALADALAAALAGAARAEEV
jgi:NifU-like protein involved in Fe-S cluster formation